MIRTSLIKAGVTALLVIFALSVAWHLWDYYMNTPWTRDGRVRAVVVQVAPDVSGFITRVNVVDNQHVKAGDVLFTIDRDRYALTLEQAKAVLESKRARMEQAVRDAQRYQQVRPESVSSLSRDQSVAQATIATAEFHLAEAEVKTAQLNLDRTNVRAPVDGDITNADIRVGIYKTAGSPVFALVASDSYYVMGYFEETKLPRVHVGDKVRVHLMGVNAKLSGHVESISSGIVDRERTASPDLLANVNPTFSWVRLAQRIPVRIALDDVPAGFKLIAGQTATVAVQEEASK